MGKVWEDTKIPKLWAVKIFLVKQKSIQFTKHDKRRFTKCGKACEMTNIAMLQIPSSF